MAKRRTFRSSSSYGKRQEFVVIGELLRRGHDVYLTLVDDQQVDCVIREKLARSWPPTRWPRCLDVQIKARSKAAKLPARFGPIDFSKCRPNWYFILHSERLHATWVFPSLQLRELFNRGRSFGSHTIDLHRMRHGKPIAKDEYDKFRDGEGFEALDRAFE